ncbi:Ribonuclease H-like superfamily [Sesbania bispinosa]|nr:Ribonuclease H-like superfamily [Sesbania bispinosa]
MDTWGLLRDSKGEWLAGFSSNEENGSPQLAELLALRNGLEVAWSFGCRALICECDAREIVNVVNGITDFNYHPFAAVVVQVKRLMEKDWVVHLSHIPREANCAADIVAKIRSHSAWHWRFWTAPPSAVLESLSIDLACC